MRNKTLHLPDLYLKLIDEILCEKDIPCRSEFIRIAIRKMLTKDFELLANPVVGGTSKELQEAIKKRQNSNFQKKLDQFRIFFEKSSALQEKLEKNKKPIDTKQSRIDKYWK